MAKGADLAAVAAERTYARSVPAGFVATRACDAGVMMVLSAFVQKLLLDNLDDRHAF